MSNTSENPKGYCYPRLVISHAVYLYHRLPISYRDVQELLFERGIDVSHETVRAWCVKFGPDLAEALRQRKPRQGRVWHLDEMRIVLGGVVHWLIVAPLGAGLVTPILWRAVNEHGEVLDVLLQKTRCKQAAKCCLQRLLAEQDIPEQLVTDGLRSYGAAIYETPELASTLHVTVSALKRQNNLIEQSHRFTRDRERQQRGFRSLERTQAFLYTHAEVGNLFRYTRAHTPSRTAVVTGSTALICGTSCRSQSLKTSKDAATKTSRHSLNSRKPKQLDATRASQPLLRPRGSVFHVFKLRHLA